MNKFVKYFAPGSHFNPQRFSEEARHAGIMCIPSGDNVIIDRDKLNSIPESLLPPWILRNKSSINNPLCTGLAPMIAASEVGVEL